MTIAKCHNDNDPQMRILPTPIAHRPDLPLKLGSIGKMQTTPLVSPGAGNLKLNDPASE